MIRAGILVICLAFIASGCSQGQDPYVDKAPPASPNGVAVTPPANKVRMGGEGPAGMGGAAKESQPATKPAGM